MAILRAGPWGELDDKFQDPISTPTTLFPAPVNLARNNWPSQNWGATYYLFHPGPTIVGVAGLGDDIELTAEVGTMSVGFCWQATEDFDIDLNWHTTGQPPTIEWVYDTIEGGGEEDSVSSPSYEGTETITLPATTFGEFAFSLLFSSIGSGVSDTVTVSIS